jgi:heat shock protein HtpX
MRILLFLLTNLAVILVLTISSTLFGLEPNGGLFSLLIFAFILGNVGSLISLFLSKYLVKRSLNVKLIDDQSVDFDTYPQLKFVYDRVKYLAQKSNIEMLEVGLYEGLPNAFATGWNKNSALVAVSTDIVEYMSEDELEAVLAHEIGHVVNGDMVTLALIQGVLNTFVIFLSRVVGAVIDSVVFKSRGGRGIGYFLSVIVLEFVFGILASIIVMWFSRQREYRADEYSSSIVGSNKMIMALRRLQNYSEDENSLPKSLDAFGISGDFKSLLSSHPPLEKRIENLKKL